MEAAAQPPRLITIKQFWHDMMGKDSRTWYYEQLKKDIPGFPKQVPVPGQPMLDREECEAYFEKLVGGERGSRPKKKKGG